MAWWQPSRRTFVKSLAATACGAGAWRTCDAQSKAKKPIAAAVNPALRGFDDMLADFFRTHRPPGMAVALTADGKLVYARGFGLADREASTEVMPTSLFRIASLSKPFTATAIMRLAEKGRISLDDRVRKHVRFAPFLLPGRAVDRRWENVTLRHCLQHTGGWDRGKSIDPMGADGNRQIAHEMKVKLPVPVKDLVRFMLGQPLDFDPGTAYAYSNFGYCLLGRVIEVAAKTRYEDFVRQELLDPLQISRMRLGKNLLEDRAHGEVKYYDSRHRTGPAVTGPRLGETVPLPYGIELVESMDANGGWLASAVDLVRFGAAFDDPEHGRLLKAESIAEMLAPPPGAIGHRPDGQPKETFYGCGWSVRPVSRARSGGTKWHMGLLAGSSTLLVCRHDGLNWCVLFNSDAKPDGKEFASLIDPIMHQAVDKVRAWPKVDLFPRLLKS
jgi:CubicO group peptidase (beta-lactamase class C family)